MEAEPDARMLEEHLHEGRVSPTVSFFDDVVEVPHGLVGMDYQSERNLVQDQDPFLQRPNLPTWLLWFPKHLE
jgi:hypothetical protein